MCLSLARPNQASPHARCSGSPPCVLKPRPGCPANPPPPPGIPLPQEHAPKCAPRPPPRWMAHAACCLRGARRQWPPPPKPCGCRRVLLAPPAGEQNRRTRPRHACADKPPTPQALCQAGPSTWDQQSGQCLAIPPRDAQIPLAVQRAAYSDFSSVWVLTTMSLSAESRLPSFSASLACESQAAACYWSSLARARTDRLRAP